MLEHRFLLALGLLCNEWMKTYLDLHFGTEAFCVGCRPPPWTPRWLTRDRVWRKVDEVLQKQGKTKDLEVKLEAKDVRRY